jgi:hypothetical protein
MNRDPIGELGGINLYRFAMNSSANRIDPNGEVVFDDEGFPVCPTGTEMDTYIRDPADSPAPSGGQAPSMLSRCKNHFKKAFDNYHPNKATWWERTEENFRFANEVIPGTYAPPGFGFLTGRAMARSAGAASLGQWIFNGFSGSTSGMATFTSLETGVIAGSVTLVNAIAVAATWEAGLFIGSMIEAGLFPPEE